ncbi:hypothetical protein NEPAR06_0699 [Nematocida parisii]|eukprot:XP_013060226.1 hypothetical protein NEPG_02399 [Nematocida parisii ERTm1]
MNCLFSTEINKLVECLEAMQTTASISQVKTAEKIAKKLDLIYNVAINGFEKENRRISEDIYKITTRLMEELEEKELLIKECKDMLSETKEMEIEEILSYSRVLSKHTKCPLLWTEDMALDRLPAYPTDSLIQQSLLRIKQVME